MATLSFFVTSYCQEIIEKWEKFVSALAGDRSPWVFRVQTAHEALIKKRV